MKEDVGEDRLGIEAADIPVILRCKDKRFISDLKLCFQHFLSDKARKENICVNIEIRDRLPNKVLDLQVSDLPAMSSSNRINVYNHHLLGTFDLSKRHAELVLRETIPLQSLGNFLRNVYTLLFFNEQGLVLHAAGIVRKKSAYIFFGASGSGKTTIARFSSGYTILSDEHVFIKERNGLFKAFAIPYSGGDVQKTCSKLKSFVIKGLFSLVKDKDIYMRKMPTSEALAKLITIPNFPQRFVALDSLLDRFKRLVESVPCFELHFLPDSSFWRCIDEYYKLAS